MSHELVTGVLFYQFCSRTGCQLVPSMATVCSATKKHPFTYIRLACLAELCIVTFKVHEQHVDFLEWPGAHWSCLPTCWVRWHRATVAQINGIASYPYGVLCGAPSSSCCLWLLPLCPGDPAWPQRLDSTEPGTLRVPHSGDRDRPVPEDVQEWYPVFWTRGLHDLLIIVYHSL
jgi:hypothetical protein